MSELQLEINSDPGSEHRILVVDDERIVRQSVSSFLSSEGFTVEQAANCDEALRKLSLLDFSLAVLDIHMPGWDGRQLLRHIRAHHPRTAAVMMTGRQDVQTAVETIQEGAVDYIVKPFSLDRIRESVRAALRKRQSQTREQELSRHLVTRLADQTNALDLAKRDLEDHRDMTLEALVRTLDVREHETHCHSLRVQAYAVVLGRQMGIQGKPLLNLARGALLHDIGKIGICDAILLKPGPLDEEEWREMRKHPLIGYQILKDIKFLHQVAQVVLCHHERHDGTGYPRGLSREIPLAARVFSIVDAFDAITSDRPYRRAASIEKAQAEIESQAGTQFDPRIVSEFLKTPARSWEAIRDVYS